MKNLLFTTAFLLIASLSFAQSSVYVSGYVNSNGTYVDSYYRSAPNSTALDNYSTIGNVNPYTGSYGTKSLYTTPSDYSYYDNSIPSFTTPSLAYDSFSTYSTTTVPSIDLPSQTIYTGPRGGTYYINSNGNKSYVYFD